MIRSMCVAISSAFHSPFRPLIEAQTPALTVTSDSWMDAGFSSAQATTQASSPGASLWRTQPHEHCPQCRCYAGFCSWARQRICIVNMALSSLRYASVMVNFTVQTYPCAEISLLPLEVRPQWPTAACSYYLISLLRAQNCRSAKITRPRLRLTSNTWNGINSESVISSFCATGCIHLL